VHSFVKPVGFIAASAAISMAMVIGAQSGPSSIAGADPTAAGSAGRGGVSSDGKAKGSRVVTTSPGTTVATAVVVTPSGGPIFTTTTNAYSCNLGVDEGCSTQYSTAPAATATQMGSPNGGRSVTVVGTGSTAVTSTQVGHR
jgi:hypothetical protein